MLKIIETREKSHNTPGLRQPGSRVLATLPRVGRRAAACRVLVREKWLQPAFELPLRRARESSHWESNKWSEIRRVLPSSNWWWLS